MALFIDRIRNWTAGTLRASLPPADQSDEMRQEMSQRLSRIAAASLEVCGRSVIRASNVAQYLKLTMPSPDGPYEFRPEDFECSIPPFPLTWLEWRDYFNLSGEEATRGALVSADRVGRQQPVPFRSDLEGWLVRCLLMTEFGDGTVVHAPYDIVLMVTKDGDVIRHEPRFRSEPLRAAHSGTLQDSAEYNQNLLVILQTINFANCAGVREVLEEPGKTPLQKKWARKGGKRPLTSHTVLDIGPLFASRRSGGKANCAGSPVREHWTRGHMKRYQGLLLFGRVKLEKPGIWCPAFKSGRRELGTVQHDHYTVHPQAAQTGEQRA